MSIRASATLPALIGAVLVITTRSSLAQPLTDEDLVEVFLGVIVLAALGIFLIPTFVAFVRAHPNRWPILLVNVVFGGTIIGWFAALIWASGAVHRSPTGSHGGESGLNIFVNDPQTVRIMKPHHVEPETSEISQSLLRLKRLREEGAISQVEYDQLCKPLLDSIR